MKRPLARRQDASHAALSHFRNIRFKVFISQCPLGFATADPAVGAIDCAQLTPRLAPVDSIGATGVTCICLDVAFAATPSIGPRPAEAAPSRRSQSHGSKHPNQFRHRLTRRGLPVLVVLALRAHDEPAAPMKGRPTPPTRIPQAAGETER